MIMMPLQLMNEPIFGFVGRDQSIRYVRQKNGLFSPLRSPLVCCVSWATTEVNRNYGCSPFSDSTEQIFDSKWPFSRISEGLEIK